MKNKIILFAVVLFFHSVLPAQEADDCPSISIGNKGWTAGLLEARLRAVRSDFQAYSYYGFFDKSMAVLSEKLKKTGISEDVANAIIADIRRLSEMENEELPAFGETKNPNKICVWYEAKNGISSEAPKK
ncbi:MAG: hypothetical protein Q4G08_10100 [Capnocytophaga sp.]|nr:hypothetical protein [Capnocytophaga sp.]